MGSGQLVKEEIEAGAEFLDQVDKSLGVKAAYWLKLDDDPRHEFYAVLEGGGIEYLSPEQKYGITQVFQNMRNPHLDPFRVRLIGLDGPVARGVIRYQDHYAGRLPLHFLDTTVGGWGVDEIYIYPPPAAVAAT